MNEDSNWAPEYQHLVPYYLLHIDDLDKELSSHVLKFADDIK